MAPDRRGAYQRAGECLRSAPAGHALSWFGYSELSRMMSKMVPAPGGPRAYMGGTGGVVGGVPGGVGAPAGLSVTRSRARLAMRPMMATTATRRTRPAMKSQEGGAWVMDSSVSFWMPAPM